jgi:hypothetical protein
MFIVGIALMLALVAVYKSVRRHSSPRLLHVLLGSIAVLAIDALYLLIHYKTYHCQSVDPDNCIDVTASWLALLGIAGLCVSVITSVLILVLPPRRKSKIH